MKTPIRILFWAFLHDQAEGLWGYIWRKKLAPCSAIKTTVIIYLPNQVAYSTPVESGGCDD